MYIIKLIFSRRWILTTLLVIAALGVLIRLGIWQLERLEKRQAFNVRVLAQTSQPELALRADTLDEAIENMEYREVRVTGEYDHSQEIAIRNQHWENQWGVHLVTPLIIQGTDQAIMIDRGWIPAEDYQSGDWSKFNEPGLIEVSGVFRSSQVKADFGQRSDPTPFPGDDPIKAWNFVNIESIDKQVSYPLLGAYIQQAPAPDWNQLPYRTQPEVEISEGPHMSYAIQWFTFAAVLGIGYPFFIRRQEQRTMEDEIQSEKASVNLTA
jgi:surfeit locus 1 family protein